MRTRKTPRPLRHGTRLDHAKQMGHTMKTTIIRAVAALSLAAAALMAPTAANAYTDAGAIVANPATLPAGDVTTFTTPGTPFVGDEDVLISVTGINASGITLASAKVETNTSLRGKSSNGSLRVPVKMPANGKGSYDFTFTGASSGHVLHATVTLTTADSGSASNPSKGGLAVTGVDGGAATGLWIGGGALVLAGGAVAIGASVRRRRRVEA